MSQKVLWQKSSELIDYPSAVEEMEAYALGLQKGELPERIWLVEHPPLYTLGTSATSNHILPNVSLPQYKTGRGGQVTYHGPGQRVAYVQLNLKNRTPDLRKYIFDLEEWLILTLHTLGIRGERRPGRVGIWVATPEGEKKIAAIGVRIQKWVTLHGVALNVCPDLSHYDGIIPCGIQEYGVTSLKALNRDLPLQEVDRALKKTFDSAFGPSS